MKIKERFKVKSKDRVNDKKRFRSRIEDVYGKESLGEKNNPFLKPFFFLNLNLL